MGKKKKGGGGGGKNKQKKGAGGGSVESRKNSPAVVRKKGSNGPFPASVSYLYRGIPKHLMLHVHSTGTNESRKHLLFQLRHASKHQNCWS